MRWLHEYKTKWIQLGLSVILVLISQERTRADFTFGEPTNLGPNINTSVEDGGISVSPDGLELYLSSFLDGFGLGTFRRATRATTEEPWGEAIGLEPPFKRIVASCISADGLELYFESDRGGGSGGADIWMATRASSSDPWENPVNLGTSVNSNDWELGPSISADGLELYFGSSRSGGFGDWDIWVCTRTTVADPWSKAVNVGFTVNSSTYEGQPYISANGLMLFISSNRTGGYGDWDIWMARRNSKDDDWGKPINLGPTLNSEAGEAEPFISSDEKTLYFSDWWIPRDGGYGINDVWQVPILPVVDFTDDYRVDIDDLILLIEHWGQNEPLCDIAPTPLGDGVVDEADLEVLMSYWGQELPDPSFIGHWKLDETEGMFAMDSVGDNDGFTVGSPVWRPEEGQVNGALEFDGIDDLIVLKPVLNPAEGPFSVFAWVKGGGPGQVILSQRPGDNWLMVDDEGKLLTELKDTSRNPTPLYSETVITDGNWHRIGFVWDDFQRILYVDDIEVAHDVVGSLKSANGGLSIGVGNDSKAGTFWSGLIDDVKIYDRAVEP